MSSIVRRFSLGVTFLWAGLLMVSTLQGKEDLWTSDFEAAKATAKAEKKFLLVDFTGSDWCIWCKRLKGEVFDKEHFQAEAPKQFVLVELDYPRDKSILSEKIQDQNKKLQGVYKISGYPTVLMMDAEGKVIARTGYRPDGPEKYVDHLGEFVKVFEKIQKLQSELEKAQGIDRAKLLDQIIESYSLLNHSPETIPDWSKEIIALDADNKAGLKNKYEFRLLMADAMALSNKKKPAEALEVIAKALAISGISGEQKQEAIVAQGMNYFTMKDFKRSVESLKQAKEAAPQSAEVKNIERRLQSMTPIAAAQESLEKNTELLEKAEGIERVKVLDQLIEANTKLRPFGGSKASPEDLDRWSEEIVKLDPENSTGLANKHFFNNQLAEYRKLMAGGSTEEGLATLDKLLTLSGITPDQTQKVHMTKGSFYLKQNEPEKAIESLKKALEASPQSPMAALVKTMIIEAEKKMKQKDETPKQETPSKESGAATVPALPLVPATRVETSK